MNASLFHQPKIVRGLAALLAVCLLPAISAAAIVQVTTYDHTSQGSFFPISTDDLINTGQATFLSQDTTGSANAGVPSNLNNGSIGTTGVSATGYWDHSNVWSTTFNLDTSTNTLGYDINEINTLAGWTNANVFQEYELFVSVVGDPSFASIGMVDTTFIALHAGQDHSVQVKWTDDTGVIASGVDAVRFVFANDSAPIAAIYREIDVIGVATVPEPSSLALLALASVSMLFGFRKREC